MTLTVQKLTHFKCIYPIILGGPGLNLSALCPSRDGPLHLQETGTLGASSHKLAMIYAPGLRV